MEFRLDPPSSFPPQRSPPKSRHRLPPPKSFECLFCKQTFRWKWHMELHIHKHTGERPYFCSECELCMTSSTARSAHKQSVHWGIKYKCDRCSTTFSQVGNLVTHRRNLHGLESSKAERRMFRLRNAFSTKKNITAYPNVASSPHALINYDTNTNTANRHQVQGHDNMTIYNTNCFHFYDYINFENKRSRSIHDASFFLHLNRYKPDST